MNIASNRKYTMQTQKLSLELLGPVNFSVDGHLIEFGLWDKSLALIAYLAMDNDVVHRREILAELLWPGKAKGAALTSLRQAISQLRRKIPTLDTYLHITAQTIRFRSEGWQILDAAQFQHLLNLCEQHAHLTRGACAQCVERLERAIDLYHGQFMSGSFEGRFGI